MPPLPEIWISTLNAGEGILTLTFTDAKRLNEIYRTLGGRYNKRLESWVLKEKASIRKDIYKAFQCSGEVNYCSCAYVTLISTAIPFTFAKAMAKKSFLTC